MAFAENDIESLEQMITDFQKKISLKREFLKNELEKENELRIESLQNEIRELKEKILFFQGELRKRYLKSGNKSIESKKVVISIDTEIKDIY